MEFTMTDSNSETSEDISETYSPYCYRHLRQRERKLRKETEEDHVKQLIESGEPISPSILWGAVRWRRSKVVDLLLSAGVDPNRHFAKAEDVMPGGKHDWAEHDWLDRDPDRLCYFEDGGYFPLHLAAMTPFDEKSQEEAENMIRSLLRHGADPYAIFAEQLEEPGSSFSVQRPLFPGEETGPKQDPWIAADLWQRKRIERVLGEDHEGMIPPILGLDFGLRSVINAILEDGFYFKPFLDSPGFMKDLQLEHRDPQGRTLFLSACRANRGADEHLSKGSYEDRFSNPDIYHDSGPCPVFPPGNHSTPCAGGAQPWTAIQALLNLGADPLATDNQGKNALHQLLEAYKCGSEPPVIRQSLRYLIARFPSLINQADGNGMCPIHTALRCLWQYTTNSTFTDLSSPENCVLDLLEAGANAHARDANGNTVLHYLADGFLDAVDYGERRRELFNMLLNKYQCAPYVNTPNNLGQTPI
jgi:ankyrin repeat protein